MLWPDNLFFRMTLFKTDNEQIKTVKRKEDRGRDESQRRKQERGQSNGRREWLKDILPAVTLGDGA